MCISNITLKPLQRSLTDTILHLIPNEIKEGKMKWRTGGTGRQHNMSVLITGCGRLCCSHPNGCESKPSVTAAAITNLSSLSLSLFTFHSFSRHSYPEHRTVLSEYTYFASRWNQTTKTWRWKTQALPTEPHRTVSLCPSINSYPFLNLGQSNTVKNGEQYP